MAAIVSLIIAVPELSYGVTVPSLRFNRITRQKLCSKRQLVNHSFCQGDDNYCTNTLPLEQQEARCSNFPWQFAEHQLVGVRIRVRNACATRKCWLQPPYSLTCLWCAEHRLWLGGTLFTSSANTQTLSNSLKLFWACRLLSGPQHHLFLQICALQMISIAKRCQGRLISTFGGEELRQDSSKTAWPFPKCSYHQCLWTDGSDSGFISCSCYRWNASYHETSANAAILRKILNLIIIWWKRPRAFRMVSKEIIVIRSAVSQGYMNNPEKNSRAFFEFEGLPAYTGMWVPWLMRTLALRRSDGFPN